ncbi:MAG: FAD-dependent oxidoreductase [Spirochaetes bacterium]|nr:FAD-dependent oxidoreductase [Spirochaetota bacterium]
MNTISLKPKDVPLVRNVDVLVVGGGYAGFGAALAAAKTGASTLLVEQMSGLGGLVTLGYVALTFSYIEGVGIDLFAELKKHGAVKGRFVDPEKTKVIFEQMLRKANVEILYNTSAIDAITENSTITGVVIHNKGGQQAIMAKRVIDCSGDGDVAAYAGAPFEVGCDALSSYNQATSLVMRIGNVDMEEYRKVPSMHTYWRERIEESVANNEFPYMIDKRVNWVVVLPGREDRHQELMICYAHSRNCRNLDGFDLSRQLIEQREQAQWVMEFCKKRIPGFANAWLIDTAPMLGVRDGRRIIGEYKLTGEDVVNAKKFDDAIMRAMHSFDAHHPTEPGHIKHVVMKNADGVEEKRYATPGTWREVPYRALVPLTIENLLVAGRNFSSDFMGQSANRLVLECLNMGQAAGAAAALSVKDNVSPRRLDVKKLRARLEEMGVNLTRDPRYGVQRVETNQKVSADDILAPEQNPSGQADIVIKDDARNKYKIVSADAELAEIGYTNTGGDVGTNLE